uniref:Zinc knuckle CX2CX4HX4C n=1 Tax=Tanacetum cinerariifolium TaxID=118510 RepID=A0A6L2M911_TANCI|nr:hypothetical protein [Tanacetum cinerariifolium]
MTAFSEDGLSVIATKLSTPLMLDSYTSDMCMHSWGSLNYARAMIELRADVELKDTILVVMPKLVGERFFMCTIRVECDWKPPRCLSFKVFGHVLDECPKKIISDVVKNPRQATQGVQAVPNVGFKSVKQVYKPVSNKNGVNTSDKIDKLERQILDDKLMFVDDDGNLLVPTGNVDSDSEVKVVFDDTVNLMASTSFEGVSDRGYGINSLLEQWRMTKQDDHYDSYDDDLARGRQDIRTHAQAFGVPIAPPNANANHKDHASLSHDDSCSKSNVSDMV